MQRARERLPPSRSHGQIAMRDADTGLIDLSQVGGAPADRASDLRGYSVVDSDGEAFGRVRDLMIDESDLEVRFLLIEIGPVPGVGHRARLVPVDAIRTMEGDRIVLAATFTGLVGAAETCDRDPETRGGEGDRGIEDERG